jgi:1-deoxy-D-xylulose-5-phosphate reductoisomerase
VDLVVVATGGLVALRSVLAALEAGKIVATANKETLVAGGHLVMPLVAAAGGGVRPRRDRRPAPSAGQPARLASPNRLGAFGDLAVPRGGEHAAIERLLLTASGGPFLDTDRRGPRDGHAGTGAAPSHLDDGRQDHDRLGHAGQQGPGDHRSTLAVRCPLSAISVVIHPQSVVHSAVQFVDGSLKAQLGTPDMRLPIQYALTYPARMPSPRTPWT